MRRLVLAAVLALAPASAWAQIQGYTKTEYFRTSSGSQQLLDDVALNASASTRTVTIAPTGAYSQVIVSVIFTRSAASDVQEVCSRSYDAVNYIPYSGGSLAVDTTVTNATATLNVAPVTVVWKTSQSGNLDREYDIRGALLFKCVFSGTSAGSSDLVDVEMTGVVGK